MSDISSVNSPSYGGNPNQTPLRTKKLIPHEAPSHERKPSSSHHSVSALIMNKSIHTDYHKKQTISPRPD